jgi:mRNA interferase HigB
MAEASLSHPIVTRLVTRYNFAMQVIARRTLKEFWARHPHAEGPIRAWLAIVAKANWSNPAEIKRQFGGTVDFVGDNRVIFDLGGNKYRLVVHVSFTFGRVLVKFIGTHAAYDRIDPEKVSWRKK